MNNKNKKIILNFFIDKLIYSKNINKIYKNNFCNEKLYNKHYE